MNVIFQVLSHSSNNHHKNKTVFEHESFGHEIKSTARYFLEHTKDILYHAESISVNNIDVFSSDGVSPLHMKPPVFTTLDATDTRLLMLFA